MIMAATTRVRRDISSQKVRNRDHLNCEEILAARIRAVAGACRARAEGEEGADYVFGQALIDLRSPS